MDSTLLTTVVVPLDRSSQHFESLARFFAHRAGDRSRAPSPCEFERDAEPRTRKQIA
jgi:hypothetical protein